MMYTVFFNRPRAEWQVWKQCGNTAEIVKRFKTEKAARAWIAKQVR